MELGACFSVEGLYTGYTAGKGTNTIPAPAMLYRTSECGPHRLVQPAVTTKPAEEIIEESYKMRKSMPQQTWIHPAFDSSVGQLQ